MSASIAVMVAAGVMLLALTIEYLSRRADAEAEADDSDVCDAALYGDRQVSLCHDAEADAWRVTECDADSRVIRVELFTSFDAAADYYDSVCDRLAEDAGRAFESEVA